MISWFLLPLVLTSGVCVGALVVNVTQSLYQAEENEDVTLEWSFPHEAVISPNRLYIFCYLVFDSRDLKVVYHLHKGVEIRGSQDKQFSGRVQGENHVTREGRLRLRVSRVRTEDAGLYLCEVDTDSFEDFGKCQLDVTAAPDEPKPLRKPTESPQPEGWSFIIIGLTLGLGLIAVVAVTMAVELVKLCYRSGFQGSNRKHSSTEEKSGDPESGPHPESGRSCLPTSLS